MTTERIYNPAHTLTFTVPHEEFIDAVMEEEGWTRARVVRDALDFYMQFRKEIKRLVAKTAAKEARRAREAMNVKEPEPKIIKTKIAA